jgi:hypothetical protein
MFQMKKRINFYFVIPVIVLLFSITIISCSEPDSEPTYTIWTDTTTYSDFASAFDMTLNDGYYVRFTFTDSGWAEVSPSLTNEGKNKWTEDQIKKWFIEHGFSDNVANQQTAWLITIDHGFLASRTGSTVYMLLK